MKVAPYNIKIVVYCQNDEEARSVQNAVTDITNGAVIVGNSLLNFHYNYKLNEKKIKPILIDVFKNGKKAFIKHSSTILSLFF